MINRWMTPKDIAQLDGMPTSIQGVHKRAKRDKWLSRKREGVQGPGVEYLVPVDESSSTIEPVKALPRPQIDFMEEFALIPGYNIQVSAGHGTAAVGVSAPSRHLAFRRKWLKYRGFKDTDLVVLWASGDSMEPTISNNDTLVINTAQKKPIDGNIYVIRHDDTLWAKRVQVQPNAWLLISDNKAVYPPIEIKQEDMANFEVIGRVVHISKDVGL